jgi:hypothetical protein
MHFFRPPARAQMMGGGAGLLPEEVGVHVGITICQKSHAETAVTIAAVKRQEVAVRRHTALAAADIFDIAGASRRNLFSK